MIFYLGTLEPRKNLVSLLRAYALLREMKTGAPYPGARWGQRLVLRGDIRYN